VHARSPQRRVQGRREQERSACADDIEDLSLDQQDPPEHASVTDLSEPPEVGQQSRAQHSCRGRHSHRDDDDRRPAPRFQEATQRARSLDGGTGVATDVIALHASTS
jgi:hypothetical protein